MNRLQPLADKIREGAKQTEKCKYDLIRRTHEKVYACAIGAAVYACDPSADEIKVLHDGTKILEACIGLNIDSYKVRWPTRGITATLSIAIIDLNDHKLWSREAIADWIESLNDDEIEYCGGVEP